MAEQKPEHNDDPTETQSTTPAEEEQVEVTEAATAPEDAELTLEEEVERLEADLAEAKDAALRAQADAANVQRRAEQDVDKARKFALDRFVAVSCCPWWTTSSARWQRRLTGDADATITEGLELTLKSFLDALQKAGSSEPVDPRRVSPLIRSCSRP